MKRAHIVIGAGLIAGASASTGLAQDHPVASLPWDGQVTAGPSGTNYGEPHHDLDLWVVEDFSIPSGVNLTRFESRGTVYPTPIQVLDVTVQIFDAIPPGGRVVMASIPGSGHVVPAGFNSRFTADFGGQFLPAGSYYVVWNASTVPLSTQVAIFWIQDGPMSVGGGVPDNALSWNPNGGWSLPNNFEEVGGGGHGVNFILYGTTPCYPNCDSSTAVPILNVGDFVCFMSRFAAGDSYANCDGSTAPPVLNVNDFICFQTRFASGCS